MPTITVAITQECAPFCLECMCRHWQEEACPDWAELLQSEPSDTKS